MADLQSPPRAVDESSTPIICKVLTVAVHASGSISVLIRGHETHDLQKGEVAGFFSATTNTPAFLAAALVALQQGYNVTLYVTSTTPNSSNSSFTDLLVEHP